jgi:hypothetical protein
VKKLELYQLGWEVREEEGGGGHPAYTTADPSLFLAWAAVRFGELHVAVTKALLLEDGVAVEVRATARSWRKRWTKKRRKDTWRSTENAECWSRSSPNSSASNHFLFQFPHAAEEKELSTLLYSTHLSYHVFANRPIHLLAWT